MTWTCDLEGKKEKDRIVAAFEEKKKKKEGEIFLGLVGRKAL